MDLAFVPIVALLLACPQRRWAMLGGACSATAAFSGCWMFAVLFVVIALDPWVNGLRRARLRRKNVERAAAKLARNFHERPAVAAYCAVATAAQRRLSLSGLTGWPHGWKRCGGHVGQAHIGKARGMGGCNSEPVTDGGPPVTVYLCAVHHAEQEGRTDEFEEKYGINLREAAAKQHGGLGDLMI